MSTTTPLPALATPLAAQTPPVPEADSRPRKRGVFQVSIAKTVSFTIRNTLRSLASSVACWAVSRSVNELEAIMVSEMTSAPTDPATSGCLLLR